MMIGGIRSGASRTRMLGLGALVAVGFAAAPALAGDDEVGCGLGTNLMAGKTGLVNHVIASCINGYTGQSISLTFGLMGCDATGEVTADAELRKFASTNIDQLARDVARGEGETLDAFAHLLQVPASDRAAFGAFTQAHFAELFPSADVTSGEMLEAFFRLVDASRVQS